MTKLADFFFVRTNFSAEVYAKLYFKDIEKLVGLPISVILDHGIKFVLHFWRPF